jgi:hypothetical protein
MKFFSCHEAKLLKQEAARVQFWPLEGGNRMTLIILVALISTGLLAADIVLKIRTLATG